MGYPGKTRAAEEGRSWSSARHSVSSAGPCLIFYSIRLNATSFHSLSTEPRFHPCVEAGSLITTLSTPPWLKSGLDQLAVRLQGKLRLESLRAG